MFQTYKVIVIGNTNSGKTSIIHRFIRGDFLEAQFTIPLPIEHAKNVSNKCNLDIWDTTGAEEWQSMNSSIYHGSQAIIYLCSSDDPKSLSDLKDVWFPIVNEYLGSSQNLPSILAVNKLDLPDHSKVIENDQIEEVKNEIKAFEYLEVSAKDNYNVNQLFEDIANKLTCGSENESTQQPKVVDLKEPQRETEKIGCC